MKKILLFCCCFLSIFSITQSYNVDPTEVSHPALLSDEMKDNPFSHLLEWYAKALAIMGPMKAPIIDLAVVSEEGFPSTRLMMVKDISEKGIVFFGDGRSRKFQMMNRRPRVGMTFNWMDMQRQVTIEGESEKVFSEQAANYFKTRSKGAQLASHASYQGTPLSNRSKLLNQHAEYRVKYENKEVPMPDHWVGYRVKPLSITFWQAGPNNLHSVVRYDLDKIKGKWTKTLLSP